MSKGVCGSYVCFGLYFDLVDVVFCMRFWKSRWSDELKIHASQSMTGIRFGGKIWGCGLMGKGAMFVLPNKGRIRRWMRGISQRNEKRDDSIGGGDCRCRDSGPVGGWQGLHAVCEHAAGHGLAFRVEPWQHVSHGRYAVRVTFLVAADG